MKVNFGCGSVQPAGWVNVDHDMDLEAQVFDVRKIDSGAAELVVAHHVLQQSTWHDLTGVLRELHRILGQGGWLRVSIPDILGAFTAYQRGNKDWFPNTEPTLSATFCAYLTWYGTNCTPLLARVLTDRLAAVGFFDLAVVAHDERRGPSALYELDAREQESVWIEARR